MNGVLLLNVDCTPLRVIPVRRAVGLLLSGKAMPMDDIFLTEMRGEIADVKIPAVLRMGYAVKIPYKRMEVPCTKKGIFARDNHECQFIDHFGPCEERGDTIDHVHPRAKGGENLSWSNLVAACKYHNGVKGCKSLRELGWSLKREPYKPRAQVRVVNHREAAYPEAWLPYLPVMA